jgi:adenylate kinase family enzyme
MRNTVIYLFGFPAAGKYTLAKEIVAQTDARLIDNHLINNVIFSVIRPDGKTKLPQEVWQFTRKVSDLVREAAVKLASAEENFIFTNALNEEYPPDHITYEKVLDVAKQRNALFVPVRLVCDLEVLQERIVSKDRHERMKMIDPEGIAEHYRNYTVLNPDHKNKLELDVSNLAVQDAVSAILAHVQHL